jgi:hypothetical protein
MTPVPIERGFAEADRAAIVALLREYEAGLGVFLRFQGLEAEPAGRPGDYAPPHGTLLRARGCGLGRRLALAIMANATRPGDGCLDRLPEMRKAPALCRSLGFRPTGSSTSEARVLLLERELAMA